MQAAGRLLPPQVAQLLAILQAQHGCIETQLAKALAEVEHADRVTAAGQFAHPHLPAVAIEHTPCSVAERILVDGDDFIVG
jgi:hypothetical protein